jgi:hypothetical protein
MIKTVNEVIIAFDYTRVVHGRRGDYAEFSGDQINMSSLKKILDNTSEKNGFYYISVNDLLYKFPNLQLKLEDFAREN